MILRIKRLLWIVPLLGAILGFAYAFVDIHGLAETWHLIGNPSEKIARIIGIVGGNKLFVETDTGSIYSINYYNYAGGRDSLPTPIEWSREENRTVQPDPIRQPMMKFIPLPTLFRVKQLYEMQYPLVEGEWLVKFALSEDGNIWMWNYGQGGMAGILYFILPAVGLFCGMILVLIIRVGLFLWARNRLKLDT